MTGKEAILHYLKTHRTFCAPDVAAATGVDCNQHQSGSSQNGTGRNPGR